MFWKNNGLLNYIFLSHRIPVENIVVLENILTLQGSAVGRARFGALKEGSVYHKCHLLAV